MNAMDNDIKRLRKERDAQRKRERYKNNPDHASKKKAAMSAYNMEHREEINEAMSDHFKKNKFSPEVTSDDTKIKCEICGNGFFNQKALQRHVRSVHSEPPLTCQICEKVIHSQSNLDRHMREVHGEEKKFKCPECPEYFARGGTLQKHIERGKHTFQHVCQYCDKTWSFKSETESHRIMPKHFLSELPHYSHSNCFCCMNRNRHGKKELNLHTNCIRFHCVNEKDVSDEKREELLRKRLEREGSEKGENWDEKEWEQILQKWRDEVKEYRDKEEKKMKREEARKNNSFFCRFCKTTLIGIFESEHYINWVMPKWMEIEHGKCICEGCHIAGDSHEFIMKTCRLHRKVQERQTPYEAKYLKEWKEKVDSGEWKVDSATYQKYAKQLENYEKL